MTDGRSVVNPASGAPRPPRCHAQLDGDCEWTECPQLRDGEPQRSWRDCPLVGREDDRLPDIKIEGEIVVRLKDPNVVHPPKEYIIGGFETFLRVTAGTVDWSNET